jgi:hypothetical protein
MATRTPPDASADVLYGFAGLCDVKHQEAYSLDNSFLYGRRDTYILVHTAAKPVRIQSRTEQTTAAVFNSDDDRATARSVRHAGDFVGQVPGRLLIVPVAHVENAAWPTPPGLFLEVDLLPFNAVGQRTGPELGERAVNEDFQPSPEPRSD